MSIGRALVSNPAIILADEPTGNLDSKNSEEILELLKYSNRTFNQTLIMITHDEKIALQADRIISIKDGKIADDRTIRHKGEDESNLRKSLNQDAGVDDQEVK